MSLFMVFGVLLPPFCVSWKSVVLRFLMDWLMRIGFAALFIAIVCHRSTMLSVALSNKHQKAGSSQQGLCSLAALRYR